MSHGGLDSSRPKKDSPKVYLALEHLDLHRERANRKLPPPFFGPTGTKNAPWAPPVVPRTEYLVRHPTVFHVPKRRDRLLAATPPLISPPHYSLAAPPKQKIRHGANAYSVQGLAVRRVRHILLHRSSGLNPSWAGGTARNTIAGPLCASKFPRVLTLFLFSLGLSLEYRAQQ